MLARQQGLRSPPEPHAQACPARTHAPRATRCEAWSCRLSLASPCYASQVLAASSLAGGCWPVACGMRAEVRTNGRTLGTEGGIVTWVYTLSTEPCVWWCSCAPPVVWGAPARTGGAASTPVHFGDRFGSEEVPNCASATTTCSATQWHHRREMEEEEEAARRGRGAGGSGLGQRGPPLGLGLGPLGAALVRQHGPSTVSSSLATRDPPPATAGLGGDVKATASASDVSSYKGEPTPLLRKSAVWPSTSLRSSAREPGVLWEVGALPPTQPTCYAPPHPRPAPRRRGAPGHPEGVRAQQLVAWPAWRRPLST